MRISDWSSDVCSSDLPFEQAFRRKFLLLSRWLVRIRGKLEWDLTHGLVAATGRVHFAGEPLGPLMANRLVELPLYGRGENESVPNIRDIFLHDYPDAVSFLLPDFSEPSNLSIRQGRRRTKTFQIGNT